ncbi:MAG: hypothetical protein E7510_12290 [Ruminococcus sp.]|nr:hypothetical protein [Ruminococcus sp.]
MNIFFFFQSKISEDKMKDNKAEKKYYYGKKENEFVKNCSTYNSGMVKSVSKLINAKFDKVICAYDGFEGYEIVNDAVEKDLTSNDAVVTSENMIKVLYKKEDSSEEIISKICRGSGNIFDEKSKVYIGTNGGNRNNMMFFLTFVEIMSCRGVETRLFYAECKDNDEEIVEISKNNNFYGLLRSVELFTEVGNPIKLIEYYKDNNNEDLKSLFEYMKKFYYSIQVCRRVSEKGLLDTYRDLIKHIEDINQKYVINNGLTGDDNSDSDKIPTELKLLIPHIKSRFVKEDIEGKELIHIIQWCLDNNNITLGYFIFDVELVKFLMEKNFLTNKFLNTDKLCNIDKKKNNSDDKFEKMVELIKGCSSKLKCNPDGKFSSENKGILEKYGFGNDDYQKNYKIVSICTITRRIRNSIAHSKDYDVLYNKQFLKDLIKSYEKRGPKLLTGKKNGFDTLEANHQDYFTIIKNLLSYMLDDIKEMVNKERK